MRAGEEQTPVTQYTTLLDIQTMMPSWARDLPISSIRTILGGPDAFINCTILPDFGLA